MRPWRAMAALRTCVSLQQHTLQHEHESSRRLRLRQAVMPVADSLLQSRLVTWTCQHWRGGSHVGDAVVLHVNIPSGFLSCCAIALDT